MESLTPKHLKHKIHLIIFCLLSMIMYTSCQSTEIYYKYNAINNAEWLKNDTLVFEIDSTLFELNTPYDITFEISNNVNYPYQNIWFFVQTNFENDVEYSNISKEYYLADEFGKWKGSGFGSIYQVSLLFEKHIQFAERRTYYIKVEHGMRDQPLIGIEKVGVKLVHSD